MDIDFSVSSLNDVDSVYNYAREQFNNLEKNEEKRIFASWEASWRRESLEYYLPLGWSFLAREQSQVTGFFLGQPVLFFRQQTQTLWVEQMMFDSAGIRDALIGIAIKVAREKNFQRVLFFDPSPSVQEGLVSWPAELRHDKIWEVRTSKS